MISESWLERYEAKRISGASVASLIPSLADPISDKRVLAMFRIHYTPTYSSWLNQVEIWFAKIERDVIARGIFTVADLRKKLLAYIHNYNKVAQPINAEMAFSTKTPGHKCSGAPVRKTSAGSGSG